MTFPKVLQEGKNDCGYACIKMICIYYKKEFELIKISKKRLSFYEVIDYLSKFNINSMAVEINNIEYIHKLRYPFISVLDDSHYTIVYRSTKKYIYISDPSMGLITITKEVFKKLMFNNYNNKGKAIIILSVI